MTRGTCPECGQYAGGHYLGCPNDDRPDDEREEPEVDNDTSVDWDSDIHEGHA